jgi:Polyketide cyclase / dehydrase and lipid transport
MADDTYTVERSTTVQAEPARVYEQVEDFHRWPTWSPWEELDPDMERTYSGPERGVGSVYSWSGNRKAGEGRMEIARANEPNEVQVDLQFIKPFKSSNVTSFRFDPEGDGTRVTWSMTGPRSFAVKIMGLFKSMDKMVGPDFEKGLARLKQVSESATSG